MRVRFPPPAPFLTKVSEREAVYGAHAEARAYTYLLGLYLGDGCITIYRKRCRLQVYLAKNQPGVIRRCIRSIGCVLPSHRVGLVNRGQAVAVSSYFRGWPALIPQCGPGRKHTRRIELAFWQQILVRQYPEQFILGCIESDGCRHRRIVRGKNYPAYSFSNRSEDILRLFCWACDLIGLHYRRSSATIISIARRPDVARLDALGPRDHQPMGPDAPEGALQEVDHPAPPTLS